ncbi:hypothetical protein MKX03_037379, partial [Papaver bracteatum]
THTGAVHLRPENAMKILIENNKYFAELWKLDAKGFHVEHKLWLANLLECSTVQGLKVVVRKEL